MTPFTILVQILTLLLLPFTLALIFIWLYFNLFLPANLNTQRVPLIPHDLGTGLTLQVEHPTMILVDDKPAEFLITVRGTPTTTVTTTITIVVPSDVTLVEPVDLARSITATIPITSTLASQVETVAFKMINSKTASGNSLPVDRAVKLYVPSRLEPLLLNFTVETRWHASMRVFANSSVNPQSPFIILISGLLSIAGTLYTQQQQERQKKQEQEKNERRQKASEAETRFRTSLFWSWFLSRDLRESEAALHDLRGLKEIATESYAIAEALMQIAQTEEGENLASLVRRTKVWEKECVTAYLYAHSRLKGKDFSVVSDAQIHLPEENRLPPELRRELELAIAGLPPQSLLQSPPSYSADEARSTVSTDVKFLEVMDVKVNPFPCERGEQELSVLFSSSTLAFCPNHNLYENLHDASSPPHVIVGLPGSGRTTMSIALSQYRGISDIFGVYIVGCPSAKEIEARCAQHLLDFVKSTPGRLIKMTPAERVLLSQVLATPLGKEYALAEIKAAQASLDNAKWLQSEREWYSSAEEAKNRVEKAQYRLKTKSDAWRNIIPRSAKVMIRMWAGRTATLQNTDWMLGRWFLYLDVALKVMARFASRLLVTAKSTMRAYRTKQDLEKLLQHAKRSEKVRRQKEEIDKRNLKRQAAHQLLLLEEALTQSKNTNSPGRSWSREFGRCIRSFGFTRTVVCVDAARDSHDWLRKEMATHLYHWHFDKMTVHVFISGSEQTEIVINDGVTQIEFLRWDAEQLKALAIWRYRQVRRVVPYSRDELDRLFASGALDHFVGGIAKSDPTPRALIHAWNIIVRDKSISDNSDSEKNRITEDDVNHALATDD
ncbi:MAG: hypothetical protein HZC38_02510 [Chloroflexi bacterium]|nr:hypothetical protein [Chloroflexota bacterium]